MATSVQLYQTAQAIATAAGTATIKFPIVKINRTWQGSLSVSGSPPGQAWSVQVGGNTIGILFAPGPFGPVQIQSGQQLSLVATSILTSGSTYIATLIGTDDPANNATPYNGPTAVTSPGFQGGLLQAPLINATSGGVQILPAPPAGCAYRLQSVTLENSSGSTQGILLANAAESFIFFSTSQLAPNQMQSILLNGLLVSSALWVYASSGPVSAYLCYDLVAI